MPITDPEVWPHRKKLKTTLTVLAVLFAATAFAQAPAASPATPTAYSLGFLDPLPQDTGEVGLKQELRKLQTTGRLMMVVAHPDDEDGGLLTREARGKGIQTLLMTLTRGEGGQNKTGDTFSDELGILRTLELLAADRYYGVEQRFSRVADFGYSKTPEETFQKWGGHDVPLADIVRVIRQFRPDVLMARFSGTDRDGHGHHQASAILTKEAFRAAGDPKRFPEQIKEGLQPWQPKKLYIGNVCGFGASTCADENYTVKINTGEEDPLLGMTYFQFAIEGLRHQESQGLGDLKFPPGPRYAFYKLEDSVVSSTKDDKGHEKDLFDGIDTSVVDLAGPNTGPLANAFRKSHIALAKFQADIEHATTDVGRNQRELESSLLDANKYLTGVFIQMVAMNAIGPEMMRPGNASIDRMHEKKDELDRAIHLALGIHLHADLELEKGEPPAISPGQSLVTVVQFTGPSIAKLQKMELNLPPHWKSAPIGKGRTSEESEYRRFRVSVPKGAVFTRPYWHRNDPQKDAVDTIDDPKSLSLPLGTFPIWATATYSVGRQAFRVSTPGTRAEKDSTGRDLKRYVSVVPVFSVALEPGEQVIALEGGSSSAVKVAVTTNLTGSPNGVLHLQAPSGWQVEPPSFEVSLPKRGDHQEFSFHVTPTRLAPGKAEIHAVLDAGGESYTEGYTLVTREDLGSFYYFEPATQHESIVDVKVPKDLKVGYIMGAGDDIPTVLQQIGMNVTIIPADKIASTDLSPFGTIVLGVRAYDTHKGLVTNNQKLLDFVSNGGTLIVQNNNSIGDFNSEHLTPYPAELSRARVSVEEAPVQILAPDNPVFHYPNEITQKDFDNWVQERGLYFMSSWDSRFTPLLSCRDPGEPDQKGGMLEAKYGKGTYIFTGYAFFRQLPAGVPGAVRLFVNLVSAGHEHQQ